jgi:dihydropteroate synthase
VPRATPPLIWQLRGRALPLDRPIILGILNVTPDSFSDGGSFFSLPSAIERAAQMLHEGADIVDVGGESTRPQGATPVDVHEECRRVLPVVEALRTRFPECYLSVDTVKSEVARAALAAGTDIINDVSAFRLDPAMPGVCAAAGAGVILMHSRGTVQEMATYTHATYGEDVAGEVVAELAAAARAAERAGIAHQAIALDPGIGFAKRSEHSIAMLGRLERLVALRYPVVVGVSRKRFVGELSGEPVPAARVEGTIGANVMALAAGARIFRVHDVLAARRALDVAWAIEQRRMTA